jgi:HK97 family phage major capsid protein
VTVLSANAASRIAVTTSGAFGAVDLYKVWTALPIRFRSNAGWLSSTDAQNKIRAFGATYGANFTDDLTVRALAYLFGSPYQLTDYFAATTTNTTANLPLAIVGDWSHMVVARRQGMALEPINQLMGTTNQRPTGQRGVFAWARVGATVDTANAFRMLPTSRKKGLAGCVKP